jgi:hypothetical protein
MGSTALNRRSLVVLALALLLGGAQPALGHDLAEIERLRQEVQSAGGELLAAAEAGGLAPPAIGALRELVASLERDDRAFLEAYWEGRSAYSEWMKKAIWPADMRAHIEKRIEIELAADERVEETLGAYATARLRRLEGAMGPGVCRFHLWARIESAGDQEEDGVTLVPVRVRIGQSSPQCRTPASPIALRSVRWRGETEERPPWKGPLPGISVALEDGSIEVTAASAIAHTIDTVPATDVEFERGFLRAGDSLELFFWDVPDADDRYRLEIELVVVENSDLEGPVLLPEQKAEFISVYRRGERGAGRDLAGLAFVPWKKDASPQAIRLMRPLRPPVAPQQSESSSSDVAAKRLAAVQSELVIAYECDEEVEARHLEALEWFDANRVTIGAPASGVQAFLSRALVQKQDRNDGNLVLYKFPLAPPAGNDILGDEPRAQYDHYFVSVDKHTGVIEKKGFRRYSW